MPLKDDEFIWGDKECNCGDTDGLDKTGEGCIPYEIPRLDPDPVTRFKLYLDLHLLFGTDKCKSVTAEEAIGYCFDTL